MGYLLKEALKTLCGINQWSYAIFWKIGYQNPKLLIWEECFYENSGTSISKSDFQAGSSTDPNNGQLGIQAVNRVHFLVTKMMMDNQVNVVGEGLVGRAAFTGSHQWILSLNYNQQAHPPEVLNEVFQQFSAGMQTIAVIPVLPHGVVQFASGMPMMENTAFVDDVKTLVCQLGCFPGVLLSENYASNEIVPKIGIPVGKSVMNYNTLLNENRDYKGELVDKATFNGQISYSNADIFPTSSMSPSLLMPHATGYNGQITHSENPYHPYINQLADSAAKYDVMPANSDVWLNQPTFSYFPRPNFDLQPSLGSSSLGGGLSTMEQQISAGKGVQEHINRNCNVSSGLLASSLGSNAGLVSSSYQGFSTHPPATEGDLYCMDSFSNFGPRSNANLPSKRNESVMHQGGSQVKIANSSGSFASSGAFENSTMNKLLADNFASGYSSADNSVQRDLADVIDALDDDEVYKSVSNSAHVWTKSFSNLLSGPAFKEEKQEYGTQSSQPYSGDDLFDILGVDFKNKLLNQGWNNSQDSGSESSITNLNKKNSVIVKGSVVEAAVNHGHPDNISKDSLLDAMISSNQSSPKQIQDDSTSCKTKTMYTCSSSAPDITGSAGKVGVSGEVQAELFGFIKSAGKPDLFGSSSYKSDLCKDGLRSYSQGSSLYGSQISSWIDQGHDNKPTSSVSTGHSKKTDDTGKTNRKRLKPGENPRPRPKDRQMIQDRVKELREIVPTGAKCSIDALLERTIKHMVFLQSVTKHADKLKQTGESKIFSKEGGLLVKDNYDGGATWAYEVGSQSMVCPIVVEDLNQPRQMLVEMLCEENGLFLEIADIIRGLGLTILKGVMEAQKDKIWARFAVEANRDVTRMEIFVSLVRLLEQNLKNGIPAANSIDNDDAMMAQCFPLPDT